MNPRQRFTHVPAFDGLRGLSVLGPLLFHARSSALPGGFLTIDVFFVLSSYLIVSIALHEWDQSGRLDVVAYAGRRARRLLPALVVCSLVLAVYLAITARASEVPRWTGSITAALAYVANWHEIFRDVSYFEQFSAPSPLYHTWSLAIEEQFYVVVPILVILLLRRTPTRGKIALGVGSLMAAIASAVWMSRLYEGGDPSRVYYGTDTRAQGLLVGIALAVAVNLYGPVRSSRGRIACIAGGYVGAAYVVYAVLTQDQNTRWLFERGGFLAIAVAASLMVMGASQRSSDPWHRALTASPTRALGRITYGVYLYHWPIFLLVITPKRLDQSVWWTPLAVALSVAVAAVAYIVVERPVMQRRLPLREQPVPPLRLAGVGIALVALTAGALVIANLRAGDDTVRPLPIPDAPQDVRTPTDAAPSPSPGAPPATTTVPKRPTRVLVIGDSLMLEIGVVLERYAAKHPDELIVYSHTHLGCPIVRGGIARSPEGGVERVDPECDRWADPADEAQILEGTLAYPTVVERFRPDIVLGLITPWDVTDRRFPESPAWQHVGQPAYDSLVQKEYALATTTLTATGAEMLWLLGPHLNRPVVPQNDPVRIDRLNQIVRDAVSSLPRTRLVDYPAWLGPIGSSRETTLRDDGVHLSQEGLDEVITWLVEDVLPSARA